MRPARIAGVALVILAMSAAATASAQNSLGADVFGSGGGTSSGVNFSILGTAGQSFAGMSAGASNSVCSGFWCQGATTVVAVPVDGESRGRVEFAQLSSNPVRGPVQFMIYLPRAGSVELKILDVRGSLVRTVLQGTGVPGEHRFSWDGRPQGGGALTSGIYFARLTVDGRPEPARKMLVMR